MSLSKPLTPALLATLCVALTLGAGTPAESPRGAKELFYDPIGNSLSAESPPEREQKKPEKRPPAGPRPTDNPPQQPPASPAPRTGALGLSYWIELVEQPGAPGRQVTESRIFRSGERIRLHFRSNRDGYVHLLQFGASGQPAWLFPAPAQGLTDASLRASEDRVLPSPGAWFRFDHQPGTERLVVIFAAEPDQLEAVVPQIALSNDRLKSLAQQASGSKDLVIEREADTVAEPATYVVQLSSAPIILEIALHHQG